MKIAAIRETTVALSAPMRNADINFDTMTASAVAIVTDKIVGGRPLMGLGFDSIGRYGHGGCCASVSSRASSPPIPPTTPPSAATRSIPCAPRRS